MKNFGFWITSFLIIFALGCSTTSLGMFLTDQTPSVINHSPLVPELKPHPNESPWEVGDTESFSVEGGTKTFELGGISSEGNIFVWVNTENPLVNTSFPVTKGAALSERFQNKYFNVIYPEFGPSFGNEFTGREKAELHILVYDISAGGHFNSSECTSNQLPIISIDYLVNSDSTLVHEYQHSIHYTYKGGIFVENLWVNEGCSEFFPSLFGLESNNITGHLQYLYDQPTYWNNPLTIWDQRDDGFWGMSSSNYAKSYLFMRYIYDHYGGLSTIANIVKSKEIGLTSVMETLENYGASITWEELLHNFAIASLVQRSETTNNDLYGFKSVGRIVGDSPFMTEVPSIKASDIKNAPFVANYTVYHTGVDYLKIFMGTTGNPLNAIKFSFDGQDTGYQSGLFNMTIVSTKFDCRRIVIPLTMDSHSTQTLESYIALPEDTFETHVVIVNQRSGSLEKMEDTIWQGQTYNTADALTNYHVEFTNFDLEVTSNFNASNIIFNGKTINISGIAIKWNVPSNSNVDDTNDNPITIDIIDPEDNSSMGYEFLLKWDETSQSWNLPSSSMTNTTTAGTYRAALRFNGRLIDFVDFTIERENKSETTTTDFTIERESKSETTTTTDFSSWITFLFGFMVISVIIRKRKKKMYS